MTKSLLRWSVGFAVTAAAMAAAPQVETTQPKPTDAPQAVAQATPAAAPVAEKHEQLASAEQLKTDAIAALKKGDFPQSNTLLARAAEMSPQDLNVQHMAGWMKSFEDQRQVFSTERHKQFEKAVADVHKLIDHHFDSYALDGAARASLLSDDKKAFRAEPWVEALIKQSEQMADQFDKSEQWLKAMRLYADLSSIEQSTPEWKDKLKLATRRIRLLALYTPGGIKALQESEAKERDEVDKLLHPATQPTTKIALDATTQASTQSSPTTSVADKDKDKDDDTDAFKVDWHETVKGVQASMLTDALANARLNYYRQVEFKDMIVGGIKGLRTLATTKGLEKTFPGLADEAKRQKFVEAMDKRIAEAQQVGSGPGAADTMLAAVRADNRETIKIEEEVLVSEFADGAFAELDPFSSMIWPSDLEEFNKTTQGEFSGVGIQIQSDEDGSLRVVSPLEDSPAYKAGIKAGDIISKIDGRNAKGISLNQAVKTITGPSGSNVTLTVRSPGGAVKDYKIERRTIKVASIKGWQHRPGGGWEYFVDPDNKIAYVRLTNFTKSTSDELDKAADEIRGKGAKAMILDLRYNPGGLLSAATDVADKFLHEGVIVSTHPDRKTPNQDTWTTARADDNEITMPTVVLVNQYSASASEIVSGALKEDNRAKVVGERTFGKGSVQMLFPLAGRTAYLKLTTSHYYLPNGKCIHREENSTDWGVDPDLTIAMTPEQMQAAIKARQDLDVLRDSDNAPAKDDQQKVADQGAKVDEAVAKATKEKDPMASDPQLSAALLLLRMQLAGAQL